MKKKGFTLIELLAVLVILAVVALIAVPRIMKILDDSRKKAIENSILGIRDSVEKYTSNFMLDNTGEFPDSSIVFNCDGEKCSLTNDSKLYLSKYRYNEDLSIKGKVPTSGVIVVNSEGTNIQMTKLVMNGYMCNYINKRLECNSVDEDTITLMNYCETNHIDNFKECLIRNDGEDTLAASLTKIANKTALNFANTSADDNTKGIYSIVEDGNTSYFYRGAVDNNWVKFGKETIWRGYRNAAHTDYREYKTETLCRNSSSYKIDCTPFETDIYWRIVRINNDGSIRLIYSGNELDGTEGQYTQILTNAGNAGNSRLAPFSDKSLDGSFVYRTGTTYVGYMYNREFTKKISPDPDASTNANGTEFKLKTEGGRMTIANYPTFTNFGATTKYYFFNDFDLNTNCSLENEKCTLTCTNFDSETGIGDNCIYSTWSDLASNPDNYDTESVDSIATQYRYTGQYKYVCGGSAFSRYLNGTTATVTCGIVVEVLGVVQNGDIIHQTYAKARYQGLFSPSKESAQTNLYDSNAKKEVEEWYNINLKNTAYDNYMVSEDFCNDRSMRPSYGNGANVDTASHTLYGPYNRNYTYKNPSVLCSNSNDTFKNKVGLITLDEVALAGGKFAAYNTNFYLHTGQRFWTMSPTIYNINNGYSYLGYINENGTISHYYSGANFAIRPVINLASTVQYENGAGTRDNPYTIKIANS